MGWDGGGLTGINFCVDLCSLSLVTASLKAWADRIIVTLGQSPWALQF